MSFIQIIKKNWKENQLTMDVIYNVSVNIKRNRECLTKNFIKNLI